MLEECQHLRGRRHAGRFPAGQFFAQHHENLVQRACCRYLWLQVWYECVVANAQLSRDMHECGAVKRDRILGVSQTGVADDGVLNDMAEPSGRPGGEPLGMVQGGRELPGRGGDRGGVEGRGEAGGEVCQMPVVDMVNEPPQGPLVRCEFPHDAAQQTRGLLHQVLHAVGHEMRLGGIRPPGHCAGAGEENEQL